MKSIDIKYLIIHHSGGTDANPLADTSHHTAKDVDAWHKAKGWDGIGYNWYIEKNGKLVKVNEPILMAAWFINHGKIKTDLGDHAFKAPFVYADDVKVVES